MNIALFDVFLSYSRADQTIVERVAQALHASGLRVFLDRWYLTPGRSWPEALEDALASCRAVAILLGPDGLGPWQQREQYKALDRQTKEAAFRVIPVVLPGIKDPALGFLGLNTWVDLRSDLDHGLELLAKAIRGEPAGPPEQGRDPRAEVCPYRGLQPFREEDASFFCGREAFTTTLLKRIATNLIVVVGASGSGKSSVVRAGLIPALRRGEDQSRVWEVAVLRPGRDPFQALAASLLPPDPGIDEFDRIALLRQRAGQLRTGEVPLPDVATRVLEKQPGTDRVLLVIDQAEELFTLTEDPALRRRFMELLLNATRKAPLTVVLTLRGDFYGRALEDRDLADHLDRGVVNLGPMTRDELARAIREPAAKVDLGFEDGLVERILTDVGDEPGKLPLMEFLLEGLWQRRTRGCLTHRAYDDLGGVPGAIAKRADAEFGRLTAEQQAAARRFLVLLVSPGEGREDTRAVAELPKGDLLVENVVRHFADARLLVTNRDASGQHELVEMSHEALIRSWTDLRRWVGENREFLRTLRRVEEAEHVWSTEGSKPDRLLQKGRPLSEAEDLLAQRPEFVNRDLGAYIATSQSRARRAARLRNLVTIATSILAIVAIAGGSVAWWQSREAQRYAVLTIKNAKGFVNKAVEVSDEYGVPRSVTEELLMQADTAFEQLRQEDMTPALGFLGLNTWGGQLRSALAEQLMASADNYGIIGKAERQWDRAQQARDILEELVADDPNPEWRQQLAFSHDLVGEILANRMQLDAALDAYHTAQSIREKLSRDDPSDPKLRRDLSISQQQLGGILLRQERLDEALDAFEKAHAISAQLAREDPANRDWQRDLLVINHGIGDVLLAKKEDPKRAAEAYRTSLDIAKRLTADDPANTQLKRDLAASQEKIGNILEDQGNMGAALDAYQDSLSITKQLAADDPAKVDIQRDLSLGHENIGRILRKQGDLETALDHYRRSLEIREQLAADNPSNTNLQRDVLRSHNSIGDILHKQGQLQDAIAEYQASYVIAERLAAAEPRNADWKYLSYRQLGRVRELKGDTDGARDMYCQAKNVATINSELHPTESQWQERLHRLEQHLRDVEGSC